jgi:plastocyanin
MRTLSLFSVLLVAGAATAANLGEEQHEHETPNCCTPAADTAPRASYLVNANPLAPDEVQGTATGKVVWEGEKRPETKELSISEKQEKGCVEGGKTDKTDRSLLISKEGGIANAVISIDVDGAKLKLPEEPILLDQVQCRFEPHVMLVPMGATAKYHNSDSISHNVHTYSTKNPAFNKTIAAGASEKQKLEKAESIEVKCDIHPWMSCYLFVSDTPFAATTKADGSFEIPGLPPGEYTAKVWHETLGKAKASVTIGADGKSEAIEIKMGEKKKGGGGRRRR